MLKKIIAITTLLTMSLGSSFAFSADQLSGAQELAEKGVINNASTTAEFGLDNTITRKEIMKIVLNLSGKSVTDSCSGDFGDVSNDWGCKYIEAGLAHGFITANASFRPNDSISKAEAMKLILKARGIDKAYNSSDWQADYMNTAYDNSIISATYSDHGSNALRGWIFAIAAADQATRSSSSVDDDIDDIFEGLLDDDEDTSSSAGKTGYFDYNESLLGQNDATVLFFHAAWCPSCRSAEANINATGVDDFLLLKVDFDDSANLRKQYRVTTQHTFVQVDNEGLFIKRWTGWDSVESIKNNLK